MPVRAGERAFWGSAEPQRDNNNTPISLIENAGRSLFSDSPSRGPRRGRADTDPARLANRCLGAEGIHPLDRESCAVEGKNRSLYA